MSSHIYCCHQPDCSNMTAELGSTCDACRQDWRCCPDCGDFGATVLGSNYCHECYSRRNHPCNAPATADGWCPECDIYTVVLPNICDRCQQKRDDVCTCYGGEQCAHCARYLADEAEYDIWCGVDEPERDDVHICHEENARACPPCSRRIAAIVREDICECNRETGRMCDLCSEEYYENCRGCGVFGDLRDDRYCVTCYDDRYGVPMPPLPPSPEPRHTSLESMRTEIAEIEARLRTNMTKGQKDDWVWLLLNRRADLAQAEKEMWAGYDADDLRKLDLQSRR